MKTKSNHKLIIKKNKLKEIFRFLIIFSTIFLSLTETGQSYRNLAKGTDFWFVFINRGFNGRVMICSEQANSGTISIPHLNWSESFTIDSNSCTSIAIPNLYYHLHYNRFTIEKNGIYLKTKEPVTVFSSEESNLGDHTLILPVYATGSDYIVTTYDNGTLNNDNNIDNAFIIVSGYDNNLIEITPKIRYLNVKDTVLNSFRITLNKGETYLYSDHGDLTGSRVKCLDPSKPISLFAGNYNTIIDSNCTDPKEGNDPVWEQIYPSETMDKEFIFIPFKYLNNGNIARIISLKNNNNISINNRIVKTLNEREYFDTLLFIPSTIKATKNISIIQYSRNKDCNYPKVNRDLVGDPSMLCLLPAKAMFTGNITFKTISLGFDNIKRFCLNVLTHSRNINKIFLDTQNIRNYLKPLPGNPDYYYAQIDLEEGVHTINSTAMYLAYLYGFSGYGTNYQWDGGYSLSIGYGANLTSFKTEPESPLCAQTMIEFSAITPEEVQYWEWVFEDTIKIKGKKIYYEFPGPGTYTVSLFTKLDSNNADYWDMFQEEISVIPFIKPEIITNPSNKKIICRGESLELSLQNKYYTYRWSTGETTPTITARRGGIYTAIVTSVNGCIGRASIEIDEYKTEKPVIELIGDNPFCEGDSILLKVKQNYASYKWSNGETDPEIVIKKPVSIYVTVLDSNGCSSSSDIIEIKGFSRPKPKIIGPDAVYSNFTARYNIQNVNNTKIKWIANNGTIISKDDSEEVDIKWVNFGTGIVEVWQYDTITNCKGYDKLLVTIDSSLKPKITASNDVICEGSEITLTATAGFESYLWNTGETSREINVKIPGKYFVTVSNKQGSKGNSDTLEIIMTQTPIPTISGNNKICNGEVSELICLQFFSKYLWSTGDTTKSIIVHKPGNYELIVIDSNNCIGKTNFEVELINSGLTGFSRLEFGNVILNHNKTARLSLTNSAKDNIFIERAEILKISNDIFKIINNLTFPLVIQPNQTIDLEIEFLPTKEKFYDDSLIITVSQPCKEVISLYLSGYGIDKIPVIFMLPDTTAKIGDENFEIPIFAYLESDTILYKNLKLNYELAISADYFFPESVTNGRIMGNYINQKLRFLNIESNIFRIDKNPTKINSIKGKLLVGGPEKGILDFSQINYDDSTIYPQVINGSLKIEGVCQHSLNGFELTSGTEVKLISNYTVDVINLRISSNETGIFQFRLFDINGHELSRTIWHRFTQSNYFEQRQIEIDLRDNPSGFYFFNVITPSKTISKTIIKIN